MGDSCSETWVTVQFGVSSAPPKEVPMPCKECCAMSLREEFVMLATADGANVSALCRRFGISRKCGYKWQGRYRAAAGDGPGPAAAGGPSAALADRSRRPHRSPRRTGEDL